MKNHLVIIMLILFSANKLSSQSEEQCGATSKVLPEAVNDIRDDLTKSWADATYIIPVVFHILHQDGPENISSEVVLKSLEALNKSFNRQNADTLNIPPPFANIRGSINIQFKLARLNPNGDCTDGINRYKTKYTCYTDEPFTTWPYLPQNDFKLWDNRKYLNIYIVKCITSESSVFSITGTSYISNVNSPITQRDNDFIVIRYDEINAPSNYENLSTLTHEVGHWLGLYHTFNDSECNDLITHGDYVYDTPIQLSSNNSTSCPIFPKISCPTEVYGDNFNNFMDYGVCRNMFTLGQVARMLRCLNISRQSIWQESNLKETGLKDFSILNDCSRPPQASIGFGNDFNNYCTDNPINFIDASSFSPTTWNWTFENGKPENSTQQNPIVVFPDTGIFKVKLVVKNSFGKDSIDRMIHINKTNIVVKNNFESFENKSLNKYLTLYKITTRGATPWQIKENIAYSGSNSIFLSKNTFNTNGFSTHTFNISSNNGHSNKLVFKVSCARDTTVAFRNTNTSLRIKYKTPCGYDIEDVYAAKSYLLKSIPINSLINVSINNQTTFNPGRDQWQEYSIDLPSNLNDEIQFTFLWITSNSISDWFRGVYIDDIAVINSQTTSANSTRTEREWEVFPNPFTSIMTSKVSELNNDLFIEVYDITGKEIIKTSQTNLTTKLDFSGLASGFYIVRLSDGRFSYSKKVLHFN